MQKTASKVIEGEDLDVTFGSIPLKDEEKKEKIGTINHFDYIVNNLIPNFDAFRKDDDLLNKFVQSLKEETR